MFSLLSKTKLAVAFISLLLVACQSTSKSKGQAQTKNNQTPPKETTGSASSEKTELYAKLEKHLAIGVSPNTRLSGGDPLIGIAIAGRDSATIKLLIEHGADTNIQISDEGYTPLIYATSIQDEDIVRLLLENDAEPDIRSSDGRSPLMYASRSSTSNMVDMLIQYGASVDIAADKGVTALSIATKDGVTSSVESLLRAGANPNKAQSNGVTPLMDAARNGSTDHVKLLLDHGADPNPIGGNHPMVLAAIYGDSRMVKILADSGANIESTDTGGYTALLSSLYRGMIDSAEYLIQLGANVNAKTHEKEYTPLLLASKLNSPDLIRTLIANGANVSISSSEGYSPLYYAFDKQSADNVNTDIVRILLASGANPDQLTKGQNTKTPLHKVINDFPESSKKEDLISMFLAAGASVTIADKSGNTAQDLLAQRKIKKMQQEHQKAQREAELARNKQEPDNSDTLIKLFVTGVVAATAHSAGLDATQTVDIMTATAKDVWLETNGSSLAKLQRSVESKNYSKINPVDDYKETVSVQKKAIKSEQSNLSTTADQLASLAKSNKSASFNPKPNLTDRLAFCKKEDLDIQISSHCVNTLSLYSVYLKQIGTNKEQIAYDNHKKAAEVTRKFYQETRSTARRTSTKPANKNTTKNTSVNELTHLSKCNPLEQNCTVPK